jgi:hypothetical protein
MIGSEFIKNIRDRVEADLKDPTKNWTPIFDFAERYMKIPRFYLLGIMIVFALFYMIFGPGARILCYFIGVFYPLVMSCAAIEKGNENPDEIRRWLIYWTTFSCFSIFDIFANMVSLPFYWTIKCVLEIWWMMPAGNSESVFYPMLQTIYEKIMKKNV